MIARFLILATRSAAHSSNLLIMPDLLFVASRPALILCQEMLSHLCVAHPPLFGERTRFHAELHPAGPED
jgi:hypothetical protein